MLAPLLYMLALGGIGAAVMFSGYSQILRSNVEITAINSVRQQLNSAGQTLSASSVLDAATSTIVQPPAVAIFASVTDSTRLPVDYATVSSTGAPTSFGVIDTASGVRQLDPWGKYYIYCRWENGVATPAAPSIMVVSGGPDGQLATKCGDATAQGDDRTTKLTVAEAINRANVWQVNSSSQVKYGIAASAVKVNDDGSMQAASLTLATPLAIASGGTGAASASGARSSLSVPDYGGTGASGTWGINISGNATTSTLLLNARTFSVAGATGLSAPAQSFDGSANVALMLTGTLALASGGTGATTATQALTNLGGTVVGRSLFTAADQTAARSSLGAGMIGDSLFTAATAAAARTTLGLGTMAVQNADAVAITGGTITGVDLTGSTIPASGVIGTIAAAGSLGQVQFNTSGSVLGADSAFTWDNTSKRLGLGTATPASALDVVGTMQASGTIQGGSFLIGSKNALSMPGTRNLVMGDTTPGATGTDLVAVGTGAADAQTTGGGNVAAGNYALMANTSGGYTTAVGYKAARYAVATASGTGNSAYGAFALAGNADGTSSIGTSNTAIGASALYSATSGGQNSALGAGALYGTTSGAANLAAGYYALSSNTGGDYATMLGYNTGRYLVASGTSGNTAVGAFAMFGNLDSISSTGTQNTAIGYATMRENTTGSYNVATGGYAMATNTSGSRNTATGHTALYLNTTGNWNTANGYATLRENTTGIYNNASGFAALYLNTTGNWNTAVGAVALEYNTTGSYNAALGAAAMLGNTTGERNTASGYAALYENGAGSDNTAHGFASLQHSTGSQNIGLGSYAGASVTTGSNNILIGYNVSTPTPATDNYLNIGNTLYGDLANDRIGIGTNAPSARLQVGSDTWRFLTIDSSGGSSAPYATVITSNGTIDQSVVPHTISKTSTTDAGASVIALNSDGSIHMQAYNSGAPGPASTPYDPQFILTSAGRVGIGTMAPAMPLDVNGNIRASGGMEIDTISTSGTVAVCRDGTNFLTLCSSDARLKEDVSTLADDGLSTIHRLRPVKFRWKKDTAKKYDAGFIAQEVQAVVPEAVGINTSDGLLTFGINPIVAYVVKAIQELHAAVAALSDARARDAEALDELRAEFRSYKASHP